MALVFCRSCRAKITQRDTTCPKCGSPTSRLVPVVTGLALAFALVIIFAAVRESQQEDDRWIVDVDTLPEDKTTGSLQTVLSDD